MWIRFLHPLVQIRRAASSSSRTAPSQPHPQSRNKEAMQSIVDAVIDTNADFGIIFDTDVDRAGAVDKGGSVLNKNRLIAAISAILLKEFPGTTIVTDSITSSGLARFYQGARRYASPL